MLGEAFRHAKAVGAWGPGAEALSAAGCSPDAAGVVVAGGGAEAVAQIADLLAAHRVWDRF